MDDSFFRQKPADSVPRGQENQAEDAAPSQQSGAVREVVPVWRQFVDNAAFQESSQGAIQAERDLQREVASASRRSMAEPVWGGDNGKIRRKVGRQIEEFDAESYANDPVLAPIARKSLLDKERRAAKVEHDGLGLRLQDPVFKAREIPDSKRSELEAESSFLPETDPRRAEIAKQLADADAFKAEKADIEQRAFEAKKRAFELENADPDQWWNTRQSPPPSQQRAEAVAASQQRRDAAEQADQSAAEEEAALRAEMARGVTGARVDEVKSRLSELTQARVKISDEKAAAVDGINQVKEQAKQEGIGDFLRGAEVSLKQLPQLGYGVAGLIGDTMERTLGVGASLRDWGFQGYKDAEEKNAPLQRENDDVSKAWDKAKSGDVGALVDWAQYGLGYSLGQLAETLAVSAAGSAIGGVAGGGAGTAAAPVAGTAVGAGAGAATGAIAGFVAKGAVKNAAKALIEKAVARQALKIAEKMAAKEGVEMTAEQVTKLAASSVIRKNAAKELGSNVAVIGQALGMELGSIYPEAVKQAQSEGRELTGTDLARVWGAGLVAGGIEGLTDKLGIDILKGKFADALPKNRLSALLVGGAADAAVEGGTEVAQTAIERFGARQSLTDAEAKGDYINSGALGALGGAVVGGAGGLINSPKADPTEEIARGVAAIDPEAPAPTPIEANRGRFLAPDAPAEGVLIERELSQIEAEDDAVISQAEQQLEAAATTGDPAAVKAAEGALNIARTKGTRAPAVRATLKVASGQPLESLTSAELTSLGLKIDGDSFTEMTPKELKEAGIAKPMIRAAADGSIVLTDEALKRVETVSPRARQRVKLTETEALQRAQERLSTDTQNGGQGDPATGSVDAGSPDETNAAVDPLSNNEPIPQEAPPPSVPLPEVPTGTPQPADAGAPSGNPVGAGPAEAQAEAPVAPTPGRKAATAAKARIASVKKKLGKRIEVGDAVGQANSEKITINPDAIISNAVSIGMNDEQALEYFNRVLDEELRHLAQYDAARILWKAAGSPSDFMSWMRTHYAGIWQSDFAGEKGDIVRNLYVNFDPAATDSEKAAAQARWDAMGDDAKALEAIRMMSQGDNITEAAKLWANISQSLKTAIKAALAALKQFSDIASPTIKSEIANLENALRNLTESEPRPRSPKADSKKPPQSRKGDGNGGSSPQERAGKAPDNGGAEPPRREGAGSPLAVGTRVSFERDGRRLTGTVSLIGDGGVRVRPDEDPAISYAVRMGNFDVLDSPSVTVSSPNTATQELVAQPTPPSAKPKAPRKKNGPSEMEILKNYFTPGKEVENYGGETDTVVSFNQIDDWKWSVTVRNKDGEERSHSTAPSMKVLQKAWDEKKAEVGESAIERPTILNAAKRVVASIDKTIADLENNGKRSLDNWVFGRKDILDRVKRFVSEDSAIRVFTSAENPKGPEVTFVINIRKAEDFKQLREAAVKLVSKLEAQSSPEARPQLQQANGQNQSEANAEGQGRKEVLTSPDAAGEQSPAVQLSEADQALLDAMEGLFTSPLPTAENFTAPVPPDRIAALVTVATKYLAEGVNTPEALAGRLGVLAGGKMRPFSQSIWFAFKMAGTDGVDRPEWAGIYRDLDSPTEITNTENNDPTQQPGDSRSPDSTGPEEPAGESTGQPDLSGVRNGAGTEAGDGAGEAGQPGSGRRGSSKRRPSTRGGGNAEGSEDQQGEAGTDSRSSVSAGGEASGSDVRKLTRPAAGTPEANFVIADDFGLPSGPKARIDANLKAIRLLREIEKGERNATLEEKAVLAKYSGWGSFKNAFNQTNQTRWEKIKTRLDAAGYSQRSYIENSEEYKELAAWRERWGELYDQLNELLEPDEFRAMSKSILNAHYTSLPIIDSMWKMVERLGFKGGKVLETSVGGGYFVGRQPKTLADQSEWSAVELDEITSRIFSKLYPEARINGEQPKENRKVNGQGFQQSSIPNNSIDLVIGNFPFDDLGPNEAVGEFGMKMNLHNYFFARSIDKVRPGGLVVSITSASTMDNNLVQRELLAGRAELVAAIRLPNTAFKDSAGTEVTTDIIILRKKDGSRDVGGNAWLHTVQVGTDVVTAKPGNTKDSYDYLSSIPARWVPVIESLREPWAEWRAGRPKTGDKWKNIIKALKDAGFSAKDGIQFNAPIEVNQYFESHPEMVIGKHALAGSMYSAGEYAVVPDGQNLMERIEEAISNLPENVLGENVESELEKYAAIEAENSDREGSTVMRDGKVYQVIKRQLVPVRWDVEVLEGIIDGHAIMKGNKALRAAFNAASSEMSTEDLDRFLRKTMAEKMTKEEIGKIEKKIGAEVAKRNAVFASWVKVRDTARELVNAELNNLSDEKTESLREKLNEVYDAHVSKFGAFNKRGQNPHKFLDDDEDTPLLDSLEDEELVSTDAKGKPVYRYVKRPIFSKSQLSKTTAPETAESIQDAVGISIGYLGRLSVPYMSKLLGTTESEVSSMLAKSGLALINPKTGLYETADMYLSGEVRTKLREAEKANLESGGQYARNIELLQAALPPTRPIQSISVNMGARWIPGEVYTKFAQEVLGLGQMTVSYQPAANIWRIEDGGTSRRLKSTTQSVTSEDSFETNRVGVGEILDSILNKRQLAVYDSVGRGQRVFNSEATVEAKAKADQMAEKFNEWVKASDSVVEVEGEDIRVGDLAERLYNENVAGVVPPSFKGDWVTLPGQSGEIWLKPHRKAVLARMLTLGYGMMAHGVGSGKTYNQIALAMELRRLGKARKVMTLVQNSTIKQFAASHMKAYPQSRILVADEKNFTARKRAKFQARIATGDYDSIILTHSNVALIGHDEQAIRNYMARAFDQLTAALADSEEGSSEQRDIQKAMDKLQEKLDKMLKEATSRAGGLLTWEQLGIDALIVDEAHAFKNAPIVTRMARVKNLPNGDGSAQAIMMQMKVANVQATTGGKNIFFATGTPITNTMAEAYTMLNFIAPALLEQRGINNFDDFATTFGRTVSEPEATWKGEIENVERFAKFINGPELVNLIRSVFDVALGNESMGIRVPRIKGGRPTPILIEPTEASEIFNDWIIDTAATFAAIPNKKKAFEEDPWMSAIPIMTMQAGMAQAIDPRLINPNVPDDPNSKVNRVVEEVVRIYKQGEKNRTAQVIFSDLSNPFSTLLLRQFNGDPFEEYGSVSNEMESLEGAIMAFQGRKELSESEDKEKKRLVKRYSDLVAKQFNLFDDIKEKLVAQGIPADEIAIASSDMDRKKLQASFEKVNSGQIRIIMGSTARLGVGVNIQERLAGCHNLSPPRDFKPAMMEQRIGRIERQGNLHRDWADTAYIQTVEKYAKITFEGKNLEARYNAAVKWLDENDTKRDVMIRDLAEKAAAEFDVEVMNYGLKLSMDSAVYSMMNAKQGFIEQVLMGENVLDEFDDPASEEAAGFALMAAEAMGNEDLKTKVVLDGEIRKLRAIRAGYMRDQWTRKSNLESTQRRIEEYSKKDPAAIREAGKEFEGVFQRVKRTIKTTKGAIAKAENREISEEEAKQPAERTEDAPVYRFGEQEIDMAKSDSKIIEPLNNFVVALHAKAVDAGRTVEEDIFVNGVRFIVSSGHAKDIENATIRVRVPNRFPGGDSIYEYVSTYTGNPGNSLLQKLRDIATPGTTERYATNIERQLSNDKKTVEVLEKAVANQKPFPQEQEFIEKSTELLAVEGRLRAADTNPRNHRYYRALKRIAGEKNADAILGLPGSGAMPKLPQETWNKLFIRLRIERRSGKSDKSPQAITKFLRDSVMGDVAEAGSADSTVSDDTAAFGQFIDQQEGRGLQTSPLPQQKSNGQSVGAGAASGRNEADRIAPRDSGESGLSSEGEIRGSRELAIAVFRGKTAASAEYLSEGAESVIERIGEDWVVKTIKPKGIFIYTADGKLSRSSSFPDIEDKARVINALGGFKTYAIQDGADFYMIQEFGGGLVTEDDLDGVRLPFNLKPGQVNRIELGGESYLISDLHHSNFRKDASGKIRVVDLIASKVPPVVSPLVQRDDALFTSPLPESKPFRQRINVDPELARNSREQQEMFGKNVASGKLAGFGNRESRLEQDVVDAEYEFKKEIKKNADAAQVARKRLEASRGEVEEKLYRAALGEDVALDAADELAFQYLINERSAQAGNNRELHDENAKLRMALRLQRGELARRMQIGFDRNMTPAERAQAAITEAIYTPTRKVAKYAEKLSGQKRLDYLANAAKERLDAVEKKLAEMGLTLAQVTGKNAALKLANSKLEKDMMKLRNALEQNIIKMVQKGASLQDIKRRFGEIGFVQAQDIITKAREELGAKIREMLKSGMTPDEIRNAMKDGLKTSPLPSGPLSDQAINAMVEKMLSEDFGIPKVIPATSLPSTKPRKAKSDNIGETNPLTTNWSRPEFTKGLESYTFDTKDREGIMERVEVIRGLAGAVGKISTLTGERKTQALAKLDEINKILAKYGTDADGIFEAGQGIEEYGFDMSDVAQVAAVSRAISMIDADVVDKASEWLYFSMLSGLQTMLVNATAIVPAAWEATVGRGVDIAINALIKNPMGAQLGEVKYILPALKPALTRAMSNAKTAFAAQHPMFDRDVLAKDVDWERVMGGQGYRTGGSITGKMGDIIRIPMRILSATDDFNTTLMVCAEAGAFAYRVGISKGMKPGSAELDRFIRDEVNTPGSFSYHLATERIRSAIFSNPLPGQHDPVTGKKVPVRDLGDAIGFVAGKITDTFAKEHDNLLVKTAFAAMRISFFPFQRTPFNILRKGVRYTLNPFSLFDIALGITRNAKDENGKWDWAIKGNDAIAMDRRIERARLMTRAGQQLQGAMLMLLIAGFGAGEGDEDDQDKPFLITGSSPFTPTGRAERDAAARSGLPGYRISFRRKDGSERFGFSYGRIEPMATTLAASIDIMKAVKRSLRSGEGGEAAASAALGGFIAQTQDKSFLRGIGDLTDLVTNALATPDIKENRKIQQFFASRVAMAMPNIIKQPIREADGQFRERADSFAQELLYQVAPYGQKPGKVDPYGETAMKTGNAALRPIDVFDTGTEKVNPIDSMLLRFRDRNPNKAWFPLPITNAEFTHPVTKKPVKMTPSQLAEFREQAGKRAMALLKLQKVNLQNPTEQDVERVKQIISKSRSDMKKALAYKFARE